jgi:hypothetical protein
MAYSLNTGDQNAAKVSFGIMRLQKIKRDTPVYIALNVKDNRPSQTEFRQGLNPGPGIARVGQQPTLDAPVPGVTA